MAQSLTGGEEVAKLLADGLEKDYISGIILI